MPWCHAVVHFEVKMSVFEPSFGMIVLTIEGHLQSKRFFFHDDFQCVPQGEEPVRS